MNKPGDIPPKVSGSDPVLAKFFYPESVVVIGASSKPDNLGGRIIGSLSANHYSGRLLAVHPAGKSLESVPTVQSVEDITETWDVAIAAVSASQVPALIEPLSRKGIHNLIVVSGGFAESGENGIALQEKLKQEAQRHRVRVVGPNGLGVFCARSRFNSLFLSPEIIRMPEAGPVALISQSGAFLSIILNNLAEAETGVSYAVNFGNRVDVNECDLLEWYAADPDISVIGVYLESVADGPRFMRVARSVCKQKPILLLKGGHSARGQQAARSHTAALAGSYEVFEAACGQCGILLVDTLNHFLQGLETLALHPSARGNRVLIASNGGGMGVHLTDLCETQGLTVPPPSMELQLRLKETLPAYYSLQNPIDFTGSGTNAEFVRVMETLSKEGDYDLILLVPLPGTDGITPELASMLAPALPPNKPALLAAYGSLFYNAFKKQDGPHAIPVFASAEDAVFAAGLLAARGRQDSDAEPLQPSPIPVPAGDLPLNEWALKEFFSSAGFPSPERVLIENRKDALRAAASPGFPLVLKRIAPNVLHKKAQGNLVLNIHSKEKLLAAYENLVDMPGGIVFAEKQVPSGLDLFLGGIRDSVFGPVLVFGLGGDYTEDVNDTARLILPASEKAFVSLILKTRTGKLLSRHFEAFPDARVRFLNLMFFLSGIITQHPELKSIELNPVRIIENQVLILDAKAISTKTGITQE
ncbi:MAG: acetate--CoA ligase family protein [Nitrospina sp.]|nr:acetate--CoA ligase family protein [Nitrospina sp.]